MVFNMYIFLTSKYAFIRKKVFFRFLTLYIVDKSCSCNYILSIHPIKKCFCLKTRPLVTDFSLDKEYYFFDPRQKEYLAYLIVSLNLISIIKSW